MSREAPRNEMTEKPVLYELAGMERVSIRRDLVYAQRDAGALTFDLYAPQSASDTRMPVVVFVAGYPDPGFEKVLGCKFKEMQSSISWAKLVAVSGLAAITYSAREPAADLDALLRFVAQQAETLGIDASRIGVWACSGNVPTALSLLMGERGRSLRCAALLYGLMLDLDGSTAVAEASARFGFANPCAGRSAADLPSELPLFVVRAGRDEMPGLNQTIDRFVAAALACNLPLCFANHPTAPHAFDLLDASATSGEMIRRTLSFLRFHLIDPDE